MGNKEQIMLHKACTANFRELWLSLWTFTEVLKMDIKINNCSTCSRL
jgi:hypothetical protein